MGEWYIVIKTIKGRQYRYRQRTWREGKHIRTESYSLGPVSSAARGGGRRRAPAESAQPAEPSLAWLTTSIVTRLRDQQLANVEWVTPFDRATQAGRIARIPALDAAIAASGAKVTSSDTRAAYYKLNRYFDYINLPPQRCFSSTCGLSRQYQYYQTLFHELAHWTLHPKRTGRQGRAGWISANPQAYAREELVAEAASIVVMTRLGYPPPDWGQHVSYFRGWLNRAGNAGDALLYAMNEAEVAADFILSRVNTTKSSVV